MKKIIECRLCCCRSCHRGFDRLNDYLGHLSVEGFCHGGADYSVRSVVRALAIALKYDEELASRCFLGSVS
jgi:hypothetical protein